MPPPGHLGRRRAPLGAVGGAVLLMLVFTILETIPALGELRRAVP